jgi:hypothetical protein
MDSLLTLAYARSKRPLELTQKQNEAALQDINLE